MRTAAEAIFNEIAAIDEIVKHGQRKVGKNIHWHIFGFYYFFFF